MKKINFITFLFSLAVILFLAPSCYEVTIKLEKVPENTPSGAKIYISGNFNNWDPGDPNFIMEMSDDSSYVINMPKGFGEIQYRFTRGDWTTQETDQCGYLKDMRTLEYGKIDTITHIIESWKDLKALNCSKITLVVRNMPQNTPKDQPIAIAGDFNRWEPDSNDFFLKRDSSGKMAVTIPRIGKKKDIKFKITRGNLQTVEADKFGNEVLERLATYGEKDTVYLDVANWSDLKQKKRNSVTFLLKKIPDNTPEDDEIYITGSFNGWYPGDENYILRKNEKRQHYINLPRKGEDISFKFTRGSWSKEETDKYGYKIGNRYHEFCEKDTVILEIDNWIDTKDRERYNVTLVVFNVPKKTPKHSNLYASGPFSSWWPGRNKYKFEKRDNGYYYLDLEREGHQLELLLTRGTRKSRETDALGNERATRVYDLRNADTIYMEVEKWRDIFEPAYKNVTIIINKLPKNTPKNAEIFIVGNFNNWYTYDMKYLMEKNKDGKFEIEMPYRDEILEFKFNRGSWETVEKDKYGDEIMNRRFAFYTDTLYVDIESWRDLPY